MGGPPSQALPFPLIEGNPFIVFRAPDGNREKERLRLRRFAFGGGESGGAGRVPWVNSKTLRANPYAAGPQSRQAPNREEAASPAPGLRWEHRQSETRLSWAQHWPGSRVPRYCRSR